MDINLTVSDIIGIIGLIISIFFNLYFIFDKIYAKMKRNALYADMKIITEITQNLHYALKSLIGKEANDIITQISYQLGDLYILASRTSEKYQIYKQISFSNFYKSHTEVNKAMLDIVKKSDKYLFVIGGRTRVKEYIDEIDEKIINDGFRYLRLIAGNHIRELLYDHLISHLGKENVELKYLGEEDKYGGIMVTNGQVFIALKTNDTNLGYGIQINEHSISEEYRSYIERLAASAPILTKDICDKLLKQYICNLEIEGKTEKKDELTAKYFPA
jgi:hypothetical protein